MNKGRNILRQRFDARHALRHGAEFGVEGHAIQLGQPLIEIAFPAVLLPEENAVRQARRQHLGIATLDFRAAVDRFHVRRDDEFRRHLAGRLVLDREVLLVRAHRGLDDFRRQGQEGRVHITQERHGELVQTGNLFQQPLILDQFATGCCTDRLGLLQNNGLTLGMIQNDRILCQGFLIAGKTADRQRLTGAQETMSFGLVSGGQAFQFKWDDLATEQKQDAL